MSLEGKNALVTGGAQGIGFAIAERLYRQGVNVVIGDLNFDKAHAAAEQLSTLGQAKAMAIPLDVSKEEEINKAFDQLNDDFRPLTILVNNAGIYRSTPLDDPASTQNWRFSLEVMLTGSYLMAKAVMPHMIQAGWGRIINLGSLMSFLAFGEDTAYCVAKSGLLGLTRSLSAELAKHNICVNTVCPGNILTEMLRNTAVAIEKRDGLESGSWLADRGKDIPLGRLGTPEDVAKAVVFFCSENADYITGQTLHINGGQFYW